MVGHFKPARLLCRYQAAAVGLAYACPQAAAVAAPYTLFVWGNNMFFCRLCLRAPLKAGLELVDLSRLPSCAALGARGMLFHGMLHAAFTVACQPVGCGGCCML